MKIDNFVKKIHEELDAFEKNMKKLGMHEKSPEKWMETYLDWTEWTSEMHDACWKEFEV